MTTRTPHVVHTYSVTIETIEGQPIEPMTLRLGDALTWMDGVKKVDIEYLGIAGTDHAQLLDLITQLRDTDEGDTGSPAFETAKALLYHALQSVNAPRHTMLMRATKR